MHSTAGIIATFTAVVGLTGCRMESTGPTQRESRTIELDKAEQTRVELRMSVGELKIDGGSSHLAEGAFTYNVASWKPRMEYHSTGTRGDLEITQSEGNSASGDTKNEWNIRLNDKIAIRYFGPFRSRRGADESGESGLA
ncbi:MAG: toast rack family protein [Acidobacteriota bacterium]